MEPLKLERSAASDLDGTIQRLALRAVCHHIIWVCRKMGNAPGKEVLMGKMTRNHGSLGYVASKPYWYWLNWHSKDGVPRFCQMLPGYCSICIDFWPPTVNAKRCEDDCDPSTNPMTPRSSASKKLLKRAPPEIFAKRTWNGESRWMVSQTQLQLQLCRTI